jgi:hypothetical protein
METRPWVTLRVGALHNAEPQTKKPVMSKVRRRGRDVHGDTTTVASAKLARDPPAER